MKNIRLACLALSLALGTTAGAAPSGSGPVCEASPASQSIQKVGEEVVRRLESPHPYAAAERHAVTGALHTGTLTHPGASYIAPHFDTLALEEGDYVLVRSPDGTRSWRYDNTHPGARDGFWGIPIPGDTAIIELHGPVVERRGVLNQYGYRIDKYARGYTAQELGTNGAQAEALCGADDSGQARCYESSEPRLYQHSRAVARLLINGSSACTGWLVGNQGHLLTNNHCIATDTDARNTSYEFMAEGATCATHCGSWGACPGTVVATSATLVKTDAPRDYTLVRLPTNPTSTYGFLQLRPTGAVVNERIYVPQHPAAYGKKIAVTSSDTADASGYAEVYSLDELACQSGGPNDVGYHADTQGGSSGSPVIGYADHQVVSLHHCAHCPNRGVPIQEIITHLGSSLPACALRGATCPDPWGPSGEPPPPPPPPPPVQSFTYSATHTNSALRNTVNKRLTFNAGDVVEVGTCNLTGATATGDTWLRLYDGAGVQAASNDDSCGGRSSYFKYTVPAGKGGTYEVRAGCYSSGSCGGTVVWKLTATPPPPGPVTASFTYTASSTHNATRDTTHRDVTAAAGQTITLGTCTLAGASGSGDTFLRLYTSSGSLVAANDNACGSLSHLRYTVPAGAGGTYQLRAGCAGDRSCGGTVVYTVQ
ncbi:trypsin-like serine peptidase [Archangium violaceum]|uniref:Gliding motility protein n=1 Tax=Archangium violaceum Cb vi76 TaxID=1406225 RepID=A0A084SW66_9BACT|nr:serine protease [Archangium violaceum]KFA92701.1 gliding motility protein [Archangium violaceum Cb vi76]